MDTTTLSVRRGSPEQNTTAYWQEFDVPIVEETMSVLDALIWVQRNVDPSLAFRRACRVGMCGTCGTVINGREGLACGTLLSSAAGNGSGPVRVQPLRHLPVIRDLVTDPGVFFDHLRGVDPSLTPGPGLQEPVVLSPDSRERQTINPHRECIYCGLCYSACSVAGLDSGFLGPAALNRAFALVSDSRDASGKQRLRSRQRTGLVALPYHIRMHRGLPQGNTHHPRHPGPQAEGDCGQAEESLQAGTVIFGQ